MNCNVKDTPLKFQGNLETHKRFNYGDKGELWRRFGIKIRGKLLVR